MDTQLPEVRNAWFGDFGGSCVLAWQCALRLPRLRQRAHRERLLQLMLEIWRAGGVDASLRALALGTLASAALFQMLASNTEAAVRVLAVSLLRELGPFLAALLLLLRTGTSQAATLAGIAGGNEARSLRLLGLGLRSYLALPVLVACVLMAMLLTAYFEVMAVSGGLLLSGWLFDLPLREMFHHFAGQLTLADLVYLGAKSALSGLVVGTVAAYQGLAQREPAQAAAQAALQGLFALVALHGLLAWLAYRNVEG
ncbi:ABC transporter permease [Pseudoduganella sp. OTU4001]|uniref:ABC transporter permease n=1 Tax=Pseudoduganella sp. OTU4001 TaxID=3043854 RepID=UPI00313DCF3F